MIRRGAASTIVARAAAAERLRTFRSSEAGLLTDYRRNHRSAQSALFSCAMVLLAGCAQGTIGAAHQSPGVVPPAVVAASQQSITVYSPQLVPAESIATYDLAASGTSSPTALVKGARTNLGFGNGLGVDSLGNTYVVSGRGPLLKLLVFAPGANGNRKPAHSFALPSSLATGLVIGFAQDGRGNAWVVNEYKSVKRIPLSPHGAATIGASFVPKLETSEGLVRANPLDVTMGTNGHLYVSAKAQRGKRVWYGASEYAISNSGNAKLLRSFYDPKYPNIAGYGPFIIAVDGEGTIYLSAPETQLEVLVYPSTWRNGALRSSRTIAASADQRGVSALATDASNNLYVASGDQIVVFQGGPHGRPAPLRTITDANNLAFNANIYGAFLAIH